MEIMSAAFENLYRGLVLGFGYFQKDRPPMITPIQCSSKWREYLTSLLLPLFLIIILSGCSSAESRSRKRERTLASEKAQTRFSQLNTNRYLIQLTGRTDWDDAKQAWHTRINFLSLPGHYDVWIEPQSLRIIEESFTGADRKTGASLEEIVPPDYPRLRF